MNRSLIYDYLEHDTDMVFSKTQIGKGKYIVYQCPWKWDTSFLLINGMTFIEFDSLILFTNELVVKFDKYNDRQVNIPYKDIEYLEVREDMDIRFMALHENKKIKR